MKKCTETQTRNMIREAATSTDRRKAKIMDLLQKIDYNRSETVCGFGLHVSNKFAEIPARILEPPTLEYGNNATIKPSRGVWRGETLSFIDAKTAVVWGALVLDDRTNRSAVDELCGMVI